MKIKLDDVTYKTFVDAAETVAKSGVRVPVEQLAETIINTELAGMDAKKAAKRFVKSLMNQLSGISPGSENEEEYEEKDTAGKPYH